MEIRLFGSLEVRNATGSVDVGPPRQRTVLAALLVDAGRPVPVDTLVDRVWGQAPPDRVRHSLYIYIARLRRALGSSVRLVNRSGGYVAEVDPDTVDLHRFRRLVERARDIRRPDAQRAALLRQAMDLWRGTPLADLHGEWVARVREGWRRQHLDAAVSWAQAELRISNAAGIVSTLVDLAAEYPLAEPLVAALMRALHETGRDAEALEQYTRIRRRLVDEIGTEPSAELRNLHQTILRSTGALPLVASLQPAVRVPAMLPLDVHGFTGRGPELARLDTLLATAHEQPTSVVISAIAGTAGVGKTALAVHWAHRAADRFPDGQLYVNMRGFDPSGSVMSSAEAVRGFLDALDVPPQRIPANLIAQVGLYRSLLAGKRMLVVLDNARDAEQVRPLLPGAPGCLVLVTSRNQLTSLVAAEGAHPLILDLLSETEARQLLARRLGPARIASEPQAVADIIASCARLPLALAIVAARAAIRPAKPLADLAADLQATRGKLDAFNAGDPATDVRAVFSWSYRTLSTEAARLFRFLGLHPGPDFGTPAVASLAGIPTSEARSLLAELIQAHLVAEPVLGRFAFHDLLHAFAAELASACDTDDERRDCLRRMLDHYLHTACAGALLLEPRQDAIDLVPTESAVTPVKLQTLDESLEWFAAEHPVLLRVIDEAAATGFDMYAWRLALALSTFLNRQGHWQDWAATQRTGLAAAQRLSDRLGQAHVHRNLALACGLLGRHDEARAHLGHAIDLYGVLGQHAAEAGCQGNLALLLEMQGRNAEALGHAKRALELSRAAADPMLSGRNLNLVGWFHALLGEHHQALACCQQALATLQAIGDRTGAAGTWHSLGFVHHHLGHHDQAITCFQQAAEIFREDGDRYTEARVLGDLGDAYRTAGDLDAAKSVWKNALAILEELGHLDADQVRAKLQHLDQGPPQQAATVVT